MGCGAAADAATPRDAAIALIEAIAWTAFTPCGCGVPVDATMPWTAALPWLRRPHGIRPSPWLRRSHGMWPLHTLKRTHCCGVPHGAPRSYWRGRSRELWRSRDLRRSHVCSDRGPPSFPWWRRSYGPRRWHELLHRIGASILPIELASLASVRGCRCNNVSPGGDAARWDEAEGAAESAEAAAAGLCAPRVAGRGPGPSASPPLACLCQHAGRAKDARARGHLQHLCDALYRADTPSVKRPSGRSRPCGARIRAVIGAAGAFRCVGAGSRGPVRIRPTGRR